MVRLIFLIIIASLQLTFATQAEVSLVEKKTYFNVSGNTGVEIYRSIKRNIPPPNKNTGRSDMARSTITYDITKIRTGIRNNRCRITDYDMTVSVKHVLPKWRGSSKASAQTRAAWQKFSIEALKFQKKFASIAVSYARSLEKAVKSLSKRTNGDCSRSDFTTNFRIKSIHRSFARKMDRHSRSAQKKRSPAYKALFALVQAR